MLHHTVYRNIALLAALFLILVLPSQAITPTEAHSIDARVLITNTITFESTGPRYSISEATGTLTWYPRDNRLQQTTSIDIQPPGDQTLEGIIFSWRHPAQQETIFVTTTVHTKNAIIPIREKVPFPLLEITTDAAQYLSDGEIIDQTPEIQALAQQLAAGKTDAYEVVYTLADWTTKNVEYSLASLGQPAIQKSSQVLKSRQGKCDELTALFISMNRALGIPARFIAGYAYTSDPRFRTDWGGHGWAEVWLPGQGWIPYDVTYGEYGYLDAGHITLKIAPDAKETSIDFTARGTDFELKTEPLSITVTPIKLTKKDNTELNIKLNAPHNTVGFGSAVLILATIENKRDYYVSTRLDLAKTSNTAMLSDTYANILLRPYEKKIVPFLIKIDDNLQSGYMYDFPFTLYSRLGREATINIAVRQNEPIYDKSAFTEEIERYTQQAAEEQPLSVTCDRGNPTYIHETTTHNCAIKTTRVVPSTLDVCEEKKPCQSITIEESTFTLLTTQATAGIATKTYTAKTGSLSSKFYVTSKTVRPPTLETTMMNKDAATPDELIALQMNLSSTGSTPSNVDIIVIVQHSEAKQHIPVLDRPASLLFTIPGRALRPGENTITATITYKDEIGTAYTEQATSKITLINVGIIDKITFFFEDAAEAVIRWFS